METKEMPTGTVAVGVDGSESAELALAWAADQASREHRSLTIVHVINPDLAIWLDASGSDVRGTFDEAKANADRLLEASKETALELAPDLEVHTLTLVDDARKALLDASERASMIVLGSRGRGPVRSLLLGSVGVAVTRHARCAVVILRPVDTDAPRHGVLVGVDATEASLAPLEFAFRQASERGLPLTVLHAFGVVATAVKEPHLVTGDSPELEEERLLLAETVSGMGEKYPDVSVRYDMARGLPADSIVRMSKGMELVVVGAHQGGVASEMLIGSVAASVVEHARTTVAIVPTADRG
ncbi:universal stress protein [Nocardioides sp. YIM 152588]|uniref:universal stress protein n=1 Tax=Nocardioides sp. YIM 152588 TaxID=3158259 RepID=UPI0032E4C637